MWPACIQEFEGVKCVDEAVKQNVKAIMHLAHTIGSEGFEDVGEEDISDILQ